MTLKMLWSLILLSFILTFTAPAHSANCDFYSATIWGQADGGHGVQSFGISSPLNEFVVLRTPGARSNPLEVVITNFPNELFALDPSANLINIDKVGLIELMTNSLYANNSGIRLARFDLGRVSVSQFQNPRDLIQFQLIPDAALQRPQPNAIRVPGQGSLIGGLAFLPGGLTDYFGGISSGLSLLQSQYVVPNRGGGFVFFPTVDRSVIQGVIQVTAIDQNFNPNIKGAYAANFQGRFIGSSSQCQ